MNKTNLPDLPEGYVFQVDMDCMRILHITPRQRDMTVRHHGAASDYTDWWRRQGLYNCAEIVEEVAVRERWPFKGHEYIMYAVYTWIEAIVVEEGLSKLFTSESDVLKRAEVLLVRFNFQQFSESMMGTYPPKVLVFPEDVR